MWFLNARTQAILRYLINIKETFLESTHVFTLNVHANFKYVKYQCNLESKK